MSDLYDRIQSARGAIKHTPESVDLQEIRAILGAASDATELLDALTGGTMWMSPVEVDGFEEWDIQLTPRLNAGQKRDLLRYLGDA